MGPCAKLRDLANLGVEGTPQYDPYEDELQHAEMFLILLIRGDNMARG